MIKNIIEFNFKAKSRINIGPKDSTCFIPKSIEDLKNYSTMNNRGVHIVTGGNSNILVNEDFEGRFIKLDAFNGMIEYKDNMFVAEAGVTLVALAKKVKELDIGGFEWCNFISGTLGGAIKSNTGIFRNNTILKYIKAIEVANNGFIQLVSSSNFKASFRSSIFKSNEFIITKAFFKLPDKQYDKKLFEKIKLIKNNQSIKSNYCTYSLGNMFLDIDLLRSKFDKIKIRSTENLYMPNELPGWVISNGKANFQDVVDFTYLIEKQLGLSYRGLGREICIYGDEVPNKNRYNLFNRKYFIFKNKINDIKIGIKDRISNMYILD